jgi:hypothetical protein
MKRTPKRKVCKVSRCGGSRFVSPLYRELAVRRWSARFHSRSVCDTLRLIGKQRGWASASARRGVVPDEWF